MIIHKVLTITSSIIKNNKNEILLLKRGGTKTFQNYWQLPEGKLESTERPIEALKREIREEISQTIKKADLIKVSKSNLNINGIKYLVIRLVFLVELKSRDVKLSKEHSDFGWFDNERIRRKKLLPGIKEVLN